MSHHILHVLQHGALLSKDRGFITCKAVDQPERRLPHADIRAVIIAARGVTLTSHFLSAILEGNGIVLHCDERYQPCGVTTPLARIVDTQAFLQPDGATGSAQRAPLAKDASGQDDEPGARAA